MAGVVGGATGAALTAIVMILEMTLEYSVVIPVTITVAISFGVRKFLCKESIYTMKLARRGHRIPEALHSNIHTLRMAEEIMGTQLSIMPAGQSIKDLAEKLRNEPAARWFLIKESERPVGLLSRETALEVAIFKNNEDLVATVPSLSYIVVDKDQQFYRIIVRMRLAYAEAVLVIPGKTDSSGTVLGVIGKGQIARAFLEGAEFFSN